MRARLPLIMAVVALAAVLGGFWHMVIAPKRVESAKVTDQIAEAQERRRSAAGAAASAEQARKAYQRDYATVARLGKAVPADDDVASLVYQLESVTRANKIDFRAVKLTGGGAAPAPAPAAESSDKPAEPAAGKEEETKAKPSETPTAPAVLQGPPGAVVGAAGLLTLPFTFTFDGGYMPMQRLLGAIDRLADSADGEISVRGRLLTVDGFSLTASRHGFPKVKAQVGATAYIVPATEGVTGGATPEGPAGATPIPGGPAGAAPGAPAAAAAPAPGGEK